MVAMMSVSSVRVGSSSQAAPAARRTPVRMAGRAQGASQQAAALAVAGMLSVAMPHAAMADSGDKAAALALAQAKIDAVNANIEKKQVNRMTRDGAIVYAPKVIIKDDPLAEKPLQLNAILKKGIQFDKFGDYSGQKPSAPKAESTGSFLDNYLGGILFVGAGVIFTPLVGLALGGSSAPAPAPVKRTGTKRVATKKVVAKRR